MMPFPFFYYPNFGRMGYSQNSYIPKKKPENYGSNFATNNCESFKNGHSLHNTYLDNKTKEEQDNNSCSSSNISDNFLNFLGINLATDDLIILALLFLLYKEDNHDTYLFMALIMLLLN